MEIAYLNKPISSDLAIAYLSEIVTSKGFAINKKVDLSIAGVCDIRMGGEGSIGFSVTANPEELEQNIVNSIVLTESKIDTTNTKNIYITVDDARASFIDLTELLIQKVGFKPNTSIMNAKTNIARDTYIHPKAIIEEGVSIAQGARILAGAVIIKGTQIGKNSVVRENAVIGSEGITVYKDKTGRLLKFPHVCGVLIGNDTEIGANSVIPRGILGSTVIGNNVVIGNLCNIGHGAHIADKVWISAGATIGGHTTIKSSATIGLGANIRDNQVIGENVSVGMGSVVIKSFDSNTSIFGNPAKKLARLTTGPKR